MEAQQWMSLQRSLIMSHTHFSKQWNLLINALRAPPLIYCVHCMQQLLFTACTESHPLICCCCRSCSMPGAADLKLARSHFHLYNPRSCVCKLAGSHTYQSIKIFIYREYTLLGTCNASLIQFMNMFHNLPIRV